MARERVRERKRESAGPTITQKKPTISLPPQSETERQRDHPHTHTHTPTPTHPHPQYTYIYTYTIYYLFMITTTVRAGRLLVCSKRDLLSLKRDLHYHYHHSQSRQGRPLHPSQRALGRRRRRSPLPLGSLRPLSSASPCWV